MSEQKLSADDKLEILAGVIELRKENDELRAKLAAAEAKNKWTFEQADGTILSVAELCEMKQAKEKAEAELTAEKERATKAKKLWFEHSNKREFALQQVSHWKERAERTEAELKASQERCSKLESQLRACHEIMHKPSRNDAAKEQK